MPQRVAWLWAALAVGIGLAGGVAVGYAVWGRAARRLATLESEAVQVQGERERLHRELGNIIRERREMAETAEHLRVQVEEQLHRLEALAAELAPPPGEPPATAP